MVSTPLSNTSKNKVLDILEKVDNIHPVLCGKAGAHLLGTSHKFVDKLKEYYTEFEIIENLKKYEGEVLKIAVFHFESSEKYIYPAVRHLEGSMKVKISGENWVDISSRNAHKGFALQKIQELHNISPSETLAFGDYNNDLEMLALADFSFAMENAHPNVKQATNYSTSSNNDFGVERILEKLLESSRPF